jgi:hypothetical protein
MTTITVIDETLPGEKHSFNLEFLDETITLREFIRRRVFEDVKDYNACQSVFRGLIQPSALEQSLNGPAKERPKLDWERQYEKAIEAFMGRGYIVLVDDAQVDDLDKDLELRTGTEVTFLKLVPLVGG